MRKKVIILLGSIICINLYAINIDDAVNQALNNNNSLKKEQYIYEESIENANYAKSSYKPLLNLGYTYNTRSENFDGNGKEYSNAYATISYNLFNGFTDKNTIKSAIEKSEYSKFIYESLKYDLILKTKQDYISYLKSIRNIETQEKAFELLEQQYKDSQNRFNEGILAKNDLLQINAQMLQAKQNLERQKANSKIARFQLKNRLGGILSESDNIEDLKKDEISQGIYDVNSLNNRSEIKALEKMVDSLLSQIKANNGDMMPNVDLDLSYLKYADDGFSNMGDSNSDQTKAVINFSWNLYNGGRDSIDEVIFNKRLLQIKEDLVKLKLDIKLQYENAMQEFEVSKLNYETAKISLIQSQENYKLVNNRFKVGLSSSTDLINANFLLTQAKQSLDNAYYDRFLAKASLDRIFEK